MKANTFDIDRYLVTGDSDGYTETRDAMNNSQKNSTPESSTLLDIEQLEEDHLQEESLFNEKEAIERAKTFIKDPYFWRLVTVDEIKDEKIYCRTQDGQLTCVKTIDKNKTKTETNDFKLLEKIKPGDTIIARLQDYSKTQKGTKDIFYIHYDDGKLWGAPFGRHMFDAIKGAIQAKEQENPEEYAQKIAEKVETVLTKKPFLKRLFS